MTTDQIIDVIGLFIQAATAGAAIWALFHAGAQVKLAALQLKDVAASTQASAESSRMANLMAVIQLEENLLAARRHLLGTFDHIRDLTAGGKTPTDLEIEYARMNKEQALEQYLNAGDRLCACIVRGLVDEDVYRRDYRNWVNEVVKENAAYFGAATRYTNIQRCHTAWKDDKSAKDPELVALSKKVAA